MTIQPSIVIWTLICFTALYFILKYLLFLPVLSVMDKRKKKIEDNETAKAEAKKRSEERYNLLIAEQNEAEKKLREEREKKTEQMRLEGKQRLEDAKAERVALVEEYRKKMKTEYEDDIKKAEDTIDKSAEIFLSRLFNG